MTSRERTLVVLLVLVAILGAIAYALTPHGRDEISPAPVPARRTLGAVVAAEFAGIRSAETIADAEQRCLAYPDPPEFSWNKDVVAAFCHLATHRMLSWNDINAALDKNNSAGLQQAFDSYLERTFKPGEHGFLIWTYWSTFQNASRENLDTTTRWIAADPHSAYALAARGMHYVAAAYEARGTKFRRDTPDENFDRANVYIDKAKADLLESLNHEPRLIAAYHGLLRIAQLKGDDGLRRSSVQGALAIDPADQWIYDDWIDAAEPKWGGSIAEMQQAADAAAAQAAVNPLLARTRARPFCYAAEQWACKSCGHPADEAKAFELYRQAARFGPAPCFLSSAPGSADRLGDLETAARYYSQTIRFLGDNDSVVRRADMLYRLGHADWAVADMDKLLETNPRNVKALDRKAYIVELEHRPGDAEALYLDVLAADPKNERAALQLSRLYLSKLAQPEKAKPLVNSLLRRNPMLARAWLYQATLSKDDHAACREALEKYLEYVDRDDAYEKKDIAGAQARLEQLKADKV